MSLTYIEVNDENNNLICIKRSDDWVIPLDPANSDYQAYLKSLEEDTIS